MRDLPFPELILTFVGLSVVAAMVVLSARRILRASAGRIGRIR